MSDAPDDPVAQLKARLDALEVRQGHDEQRERRRMFWQAAGLSIALATTIFLVWQTTLMRGQFGLQAKQLELQMASDYESRRTQLYGTLYDRAQGCGSEQLRCPMAAMGIHCLPGDAVCPVAASPPARAQALRELLKLDAEHKRETDLTFLDATDLQLQGVDFHGADLSGADFTRASLSGASFKDTTIDRAVFRAAFICSRIGEGAAGWVNFEGALFCAQAWQDFEFGHVVCPDGSTHDGTCPPGTQNGQQRYRELQMRWNRIVDNRPGNTMIGTTEPVALPDAGPPDATLTHVGE